MSDSGRPFLQATGITTLAIGVGIALCTIVLIAVSVLRSYTRSPADILPASATVALLVNVEDDTLQRLLPWLPNLRSLPASPSSRTVAIVRQGKDAMGIVLFSRRGTGPNVLLPAGWQEREIGPLIVAASSPDVLSLIEHESSPLSASTDYRLLARYQEKTLPFLFLDSTTLPTPPTLSDTIVRSLLLQKAEHVALIPRAQSGTTLLIPGTEREADTAINETFLPNTIVSLSLPSFEKLWTTLQHELPMKQQLLLQTYTLTTVARLFGESVSAEEDLFPLFVGPSSLSIVHTASGGNAFLLHGTEGPPDTEKRLMSLHTAFRTELGTMRTVQRTLEKGRFTFVNIRDDATLVREEESDVDGWHLHETAQDTEGKLLLTAQKGNEFFIGSDRQSLASALGLKSPAVKNAKARGIIDLTSPMLPPLPFVLSSGSPLLPLGSSTIEWSLTNMGSITALNLKPVMRK